MIPDIIVEIIVACFNFIEKLRLGHLTIHVKWMIARQSEQQKVVTPGATHMIMEIESLQNEHENTQGPSIHRLSVGLS